MTEPKKVLIIDDDAHIRKVIELKLKKAGYQIIVAGNGEEGFELIEVLKPDAVVSDINMPKMDGKTLCLKTNPLKQERPFLTIIISARISLDDEEWIKDMTDTQFMEKPFSPNKLLGAIDRYFQDERE
ncbi:MAG: response regulator [Deltaproteobacteria bacterium]|nr:response regulator [Deltaproteobacteria bacterium]